MIKCIECKVVLGYYLRVKFEGLAFKLQVDTLPTGCYLIDINEKFSLNTYTINKKVYFQNPTTCFYLDCKE